MKVSLSRAAEIVGIDIESFKELLREAGVARMILQQARWFSMKLSNSCVSGKPNEWEKGYPRCPINFSPRPRSQPAE